MVTYIAIRARGALFLIPETKLTRTKIRNYHVRLFRGLYLRAITHVDIPSSYSAFHLYTNPRCILEGSFNVYLEGRTRPLQLAFALDLRMTSSALSPLLAAYHPPGTLICSRCCMRLDPTQFRQDAKVIMP